MRKLFSIFALVIFSVTMAFGQAAADIPLTISNDVGDSYTLHFGLDPTATDGIDVSLGEAELPPWAQGFETRFVLPPFAANSLTSYRDYRGASLPSYTGQKIHRLKYQAGDGTVININWNFPTGVTGRLQDILIGSLIDVAMTGTGSYQVANPSGFPELKLTIDYTNYGSVPAPIFEIAPSSPLGFGTVNVGNNAMLPVTVSNTGTATLNITNLTSSDPQFTFSPSAPVNIPAGGNQVFNVTFTPAGNGPQSSTLTFTHNGPGPTTLYTVQGTGLTLDPIFSIAPVAPLIFPTAVAIGSSANLNVTVTNTGTAPLNITALASSNSQFTFTPSAPVTIAAGLNQVFVVTFTPTANGLQSTNLTFTHNGPGPTTVYGVQGTGFTPAPSFSINPTSLDFGQVSLNTPSVLTVTVSNSGTAPLDITGLVSSDLQFTFTPIAPVTINAGLNAVFNVTFTPTASGLQSGNISFTHNAVGSPSVLPVQGSGRTQGGTLEFVQQTRTLYDGTSNNQDAIVLRGYTGQPLKSLQFDLVLGKANEKLVLNSVSRGDGIPDPNFIFDYQVYPGPVQPDGSHRDRIKVVILGNTNNVIPPNTGDVEIMKFSYNVVSIVGNSTTTTNGLENVYGATATPVVNANIATGPDEDLTIYNGTILGLLGDVNLDNTVDLLDILVMIDHILGRITLTGQAFTNGDIAPWLAPASLPTPDFVINVLDLAVLQNIVATGLYPSGTPVNKSVGNPFTITELQKMTPGMDAKLTFHFGKNGITVTLESDKKVKGAQIEMNGVGSTIPADAQISSVFNTKLYYQLNDFLRTLTYDGQSLPMDAGEYLLASIPFSLSNPRDIEISKIIVADENNTAMQKVEVEIKYDDEQTIPSDYSLSQNFPNPFNPSTSVEFSVPVDGFVTIRVYDLLGQVVADLYSGNAQAGTYTLNWDGKDNSGNALSTGNYIYRMTAGDFVQSKKMTYLK